MNASIPNVKRTFFRQGALLVLPLLVLAALGLCSLRQDRLLGEREAAERAQGIAHDVASRLWAELTATNTHDGARAFEVDAAAQLMYPPPESRLPADQFLRELFAAVSPHLGAITNVSVPLLSSEDLRDGGARWLPPPALREPVPAGFWFQFPEHTSGQHWLAMRCQETLTNAWYVCRSEAEIGAWVAGATHRRMSDYFGIGVELAGTNLDRYTPDRRLWHIVHYMGGKGAGQTAKQYSGDLASQVLAEASVPEDGPRLLTVRVYLTSSQALWERQRARVFWLAALIAASALASGVGLVSAWRAFNRQQRLSEMKSNFVSSVSHELRAPIASVRLLAESLERGAIGEAPKQQEYFHLIVQECRRLSALIENVLDFSRIEQGRKQYQFEPTDVLALAQQTVKLMEPAAAERQVQLTFDPSAYQTSALASPPVLDGKALEQALVNLIDNAIKHSPAGGTVTVGLEGPRSGPASGLWSEAIVCFWVEDHGDGIPAAQHEKIFERFYRRGSELRRETQGVGIGLSIVKHIVAAHEGRVHVRSAVGQGSRFTIELPIAPEGPNSMVRHEL